MPKSRPRSASASRNISFSNPLSSDGRTHSVDESLMLAKSLTKTATKTASAAVSTHVPSVESIPSVQFLGQGYLSSRPGKKKIKKTKASRSVSPQRSIRRHFLGSSSEDEAPPAFIPTTSPSASGSKEFNSVANVSIANRALKTLAASIASR